MEDTMTILKGYPKKQTKSEIIIDAVFSILALTGLIILVFLLAIAGFI